MSSLTINKFRDYGNSDEEIARVIGKANGFFAVLRYKNSQGASEFTNFGTCDNELEVNEYLTSSHCHEAEIVYQGSVPKDEYYYPASILKSLIELSGDQDLEMVIRFLLDSGIDVNEQSDSGWTPLHEAAKTGQTDIASLLIQHGAELNAANHQYLYTPLHIAANYGHADTLLLLIHEGADIKTESIDGMESIYIAADKNHTEIIKILLDNGADINSKDKDGGTALHAASGKNQKEAALFLLKNGAEINLQNEFGVTPLHYAAFFNNPEMVSLLLEHGADKDITNSDGKTPLQIAEEKAHDDVIRCLSDNKSRSDKVKTSAPVIGYSEQNTDTVGKQQKIIIFMAAGIVLVLIAVFFFALDKNKRSPGPNIVLPAKKEDHKPVTVSIPVKTLEEAGISAQSQSPKIVEQTRQTQTEKKIKSIAQTLKSPEVFQPSYHVIVGSFKIKNNAVNYAESLKAKGYPKCSVLFYDNRNLVSVESFETVSQARLKKKEVLNNSGLESWIYTE